MSRITNSLDRALDVLERIEQTRGGLRGADLSRELGIPKSTCHYITSKLEKKGYLERDPATGRYRIGLATVPLAYGALREIGFRSIAEPALYRLTRVTRLSAGIGVLERGHVLLIDRVEGPDFVDSALQLANRAPEKDGRAEAIPRAYRFRELRDIGRELPAHTTALGKVLLAYLPGDQLEALLETHGLAPRTPKTIVSKAKLLDHLAGVRKLGYAVADEEAYLGIRALSAPIFDAAGQVRAAVSVNGDAKERAWDDLPELVRVVQATAADISRRTKF
jgi:IclR family KDG regulon transcriptional repressor